MTENLVRVELYVTKQFVSETLPMLSYIKKLASWGHSFKVLVDPKDSSYEKAFFVDGDGNSHIRHILVNGQDYEWREDV